jgi:hypothetical protein
MSQFKNINDDRRAFHGTAPALHSQKCYLHKSIINIQNSYNFAHNMQIT